MIIGGKEVSAPRPPFGSLAIPTARTSISISKHTSPKWDHTFVITSFRRPELLARCVKSCMSENVVIAAARWDGIESACSGKRMIWTSDNNNESWIQGLRSAGTGMATLLHDDDQLLEEFRNVNCSGKKLILWGAVHGSETASIAGVELNELGLEKDGEYPTEILRDHLLKRSSFAMSPVRGMYPTADAIEALEMSTGIAPEMRPGFVVGNDLMLWLHLTKKHRTFWFHKKPVVRLGSDSSVSASCSSPGSVMDCYNTTRSRLLSLKPNLVVASYFPPVTYKGMYRFLRNIDQNAPSSPTVFFSDTGHNRSMVGKWSRSKHSAEILRSWNASSIIGSEAFFGVAREVLHSGATHMLWLEADCRVTKPGWDEDILSEFVCKRGACCGGTPVMWNAFSVGGRFDSAVLSFAARHLELSGIPPAFEGGMYESTSIYPNGALAIYSIDELLSLFGWKAFVDPASCTKEITPFDHAFGLKMFERYGESVLDMIAPVSCSYSGCGDKRVSEAQRIEMVKSGSKVAVHQIKRDDM